MPYVPYLPVRLNAPLHAVGKETAKGARSAQISCAILPSCHFQFTIGISWAHNSEAAIKVNINAPSHKWPNMTESILGVFKILVAQYEDVRAG
jgi:hypothetical protein